jgi:hypothetical protein
MLVSDRRWRVQGLFPTLFSWVWIQALYSLGVPASRLARWYRPVRDNLRSRRVDMGAVMDNDASGQLDPTDRSKNRCVHDES